MVCNFYCAEKELLIRSITNQILSHKQEYGVDGDVFVRSRLTVRKQKCYVLNGTSLVINYQSWSFPGLRYTMTMSMTCQSCLHSGLEVNKIIIVIAGRQRLATHRDKY